MNYICPVCKTDNSHPLTFHVEQYICTNCGHLIEDNQPKKQILAKPKNSVVLKVGSQGFLDGKEWYVVAIIVRKYGSSVYWREYYLKDKNGENAFLSESDGHWVLMYPKEVPLKDNKYYCEFENKKYRWFETTPNAIHAAEGFFEDKIYFGLANYKEFVNGQQMVSREEHGTRKEFYWGKHISRFEVKKGFKIASLPSYYGIGIVQPYYFNLRQFLNVLGVSAVLMCLVYLFNYVTKTNYEVFNQKIKFSDVYNKELVSESFYLNGASAPLVVSLYSNVDNSWANAELSLVNEETNEVEYTSQDIEKYSGYTDGESWSEGSREKEFNFCGVAPGKYHFEIAAQKQGMESSGSRVYFSPDGTKSFTETSDGWIDVVTVATSDKVSYNVINFKQLHPDLDKEFIEAKKFAETNPQQVIDVDSSNPAIEIKAVWKPVTMWNLGILLFTMAVVGGLAYWGRYAFQSSKWSNSSNSPYPKSSE